MDEFLYDPDMDREAYGTFLLTWIDANPNLRISTIATTILRTHDWCHYVIHEALMKREAELNSFLVN